MKSGLAKFIGVGTAIAVIVLLPYLVQVGVVVSWRVFPAAKTVVNGHRYTIRRGDGSAWDFFPVLGVWDMFDPCYLDIENLETGESTREDYDFVSQAIVTYQNVFTEEYRKMRE